MQKKKLIKHSANPLFMKVTMFKKIISKKENNVSQVDSVGVNRGTESKTEWQWIPNSWALHEVETHSYLNNNYGTGWYKQLTEIFDYGSFNNNMCLMLNKF